MKAMKQQKQAKKYHAALMMHGSNFWQVHLRRALTNRKRMSALRKIELKFPNSVQVRFKKRVGKCDTVHVSSTNKAFVSETVAILQQEKSAIEKLHRFVKCEKKLRGAVIGKGGKAFGPSQTPQDRERASSATTPKADFSSHRLKRGH